MLSRHPLEDNSGAECDSFVSITQWGFEFKETIAYLGQKFSFINVEICSANTTCLDLDLDSTLRFCSYLLGELFKSPYQDIVVTQLWYGDFDDSIFLGLRVSAFRGGRLEQRARECPFDA